MGRKYRGEWPVYDENVISDKTGKIIRKKGDKYDAHHITENTFRGEHGRICILQNSQVTSSRYSWNRFTSKCTKGGKK